MRQPAGVRTSVIRTRVSPVVIFRPVVCQCLGKAATALPPPCVW